MTARRVVFYLSTSIFLTVFLFAGCSQKEEDVGDSKLMVKMQSLTAAQVSRVQVTVCGTGMLACIDQNLNFVDGQWAAVVPRIPAGDGRTFTADAFDAAGTLVFSGQANDVTIISGETISVLILMQQAQEAESFENALPRFESLVFSKDLIAPAESITLAANATDPDDEILMYTWTSSAGVFDETEAAATVWTAPGEEGLYELTVTVKDSKEASATLSFGVDVNTAYGIGKADMNVQMNIWPSVSGLVAQPPRIDVGESTNLDLTAYDNDGDELFYSWSADCQGTFDDPTVQDPSFTLISENGGTDCTLVATIDDNRGGTNTASVSLATGPAAMPAADPSGCEIPGEFITSHVWSPAGNRMALSKCPSGQLWNCELWVADANCSNERLVQTGIDARQTLDWQGDWILFSIRHEDALPGEYYGRGEYWKVNPDDGAAPVQLTFTFSNGIRTSFSNHVYDNIGTVKWAKFVPHASLVYFYAHNGNGWYETFVCNADGTDGWRRISGPDYSWTAAISPTGNRLLYGQTGNYYKPVTLVAADLDGSNKTTLVGGLPPGATYLVSSDGSTVAYNNNGIHLVDMDGTNQRSLVGTDGNWIVGSSQRPWSPDGQWLLFVSNRTGTDQIYKIRMDGSHLTARTGDSDYHHGQPTFSPDGAALSYIKRPVDPDSSTETRPYKLFVTGVE